MEVVSVPTIFVRNPFLRLKRKRIEPTVGLKEGKGRRLFLSRGAEGVDLKRLEAAEDKGV